MSTKTVLEWIKNAQWAKQPSRGMEDMAEAFQYLNVDKEISQEVSGILFDYRYDAAAALEDMKE